MITRFILLFISCLIVGCASSGPHYETGEYRDINDAACVYNDPTSNEARPADALSSAFVLGGIILSDSKEVKDENCN